MMASLVSTVGVGARSSYSPSTDALKKKHSTSPAAAAAAAAQRPPLRNRVLTVKAGGGINPEIRKSEAKVVDDVLVSELSKPLTAYCRCWRSGTFPLCDGSHVKHNKATGDNVGPLLIKKEK